MTLDNSQLILCSANCARTKTFSTSFDIKTHSKYFTSASLGIRLTNEVALSVEYEKKGNGEKKRENLCVELRACHRTNRRGK